MNRKESKKYRVLNNLIGRLEKLCSVFAHCLNLMQFPFGVSLSFAGAHGLICINSLRSFQVLHGVVKNINKFNDRYIYCYIDLLVLMRPERQVVIKTAWRRSICSGYEKGGRSTLNAW